MDTDSNQPVLKRYLNQQGKLHRAWGLGDSRIIVNFVDIIVPLWSAGGKKAYFQRYIHRWYNMESAVNTLGKKRVDAYAVAEMKQE